MKKILHFSRVLSLALFLVPFLAFSQTVEVHIQVQNDPNTGEPMGTVSVNGGTAVTSTSITCSVGDHISITAQGNNPMQFAKWQDFMGVELSTSNPWNVEITSEIAGDMWVQMFGYWEITAAFQAPQYEFSVVSVPEGIGTYSNLGTYSYNTNVTTEVTGFDNVHYDFLGFSETNNPDDIQNDNTYHEVTILGNTTLYAFYQYKPQQVTVTAAPNNSTLGSVTINGEPANVAELTEQTDNTFVAIPAANNVNFCGWYLVNGNQKALVTENTTMNVNLPPFSEPRTYEAAFVGQGQTLSCSVSAINEGGTPAGPAASTYNSQVTIRAQVASGYEFVAWYEDLNGDGVFADDEIVQGAGADYTFNITRNRVFGAKYHHLPMTITITNDATKGTLSTENEFQVEYNAPVTIAISENPGYHFTGWTGIASNDNPLFIEHVTTDYNLTANYVNTYTFNATASDGGSVTVTPQNGIFNEGESVSAQATANDGMEFAYWVVNGTNQSTENPFEVQSISSNYEIVAHFVHKYRLTLAASSPATNATFTITTTNGTVTYDPTQEYYFNEGTEITVTVTNFNSEGWGFLCWKNAGAAGCLDETPELSSTFTISDNTNLEASFYNVAVNRTVTYSVNPVDAGTVTGTYLSFDANNQATVPDNTTTTLTANPAEGYTIDYWMIDNGSGNVRYDEANPTLTITANTTIAAYFREVGQINVTVVVHPAGAGTVLPFEGVQTFTDGDNISLTATPADNYNFWGWIINSEPVGAMGQNEITIQSLSEDVTIHAWFYTPEIDGTMDFLTFSSDNTTVTGVRPEYKTRITAINVPPTHNNVAVTAIANDAFAGCTSLESLYIPASVTTVGSYAFSNCVALTNIDIPSTVVSIGDNAFYGCTSLQQVELPEQLTAVEENLFYNCSSLNSVNIPANVTSIGNGAFYGCSSLYAIEIPASVTTVGMQAFMGANSLRSVTINGGVQSFGEDCFSGCTSIAQVAYNGAFEHWFDIEFENAYANPAARTRDLFVNGTQVTKLIIPDGVNTVNKYAFYLNSHIDTIVIPATVTMIDSAAFYRLTNLKRIVIEDNPAEVTAHADAFSNVNKDQVVVEVPCNYVENTTQWNGFTRIVGTGIPVLTLVQRPGGTATILSAPTCGDQYYIYSLTAQASGVYTFISWSDGVLSPSRVDTLTADKTLSPIFDRNGAAEAIIDKNIYFESGTADQEWFRISNGDNEWVVGNAVAEPNTGSRSLYVSKDGGVHCNYNPGTSPYAYTEVKLHQGIYRFNFNYLVGDDPDDNLTVALMPIPDNEDDEAYANLDPYAEQLPMLIDGLTGDGITWKNDFRLFNIPTEKWYRLVFFWNVNSDNVDDEAVAAAVDNISLSWMTPKPDELSRLTVKVMVSSNDIDKGYAYTWTDDETQMIVDGEPMSVTPEYVHGRRQKTFTYADEIWIHAVPETGYRFVNWSDGVTDANRQLDFMTIYGSETPLYVAYFEAIPDAWDVAVLLESGAEDENQNPASSQYGVMNPVEVEFQGNSTTVYVITNNASFPLDLTNPTNYPTATVVLNEPLAGWAFVGWANENGDTVSTDNPYTFSYNEFNRDVTLTALMNKLTPCSYVDNDFFNRNMPFGQFNFRGHDLDDVTVSNIEVSVRNGQILVSEANGVEVSLYDVNGRLLESKVENSQNINFEVPTSGTYMLKVGDLLTRRVVVVR